MEPNKILSANILDLIFDDRNKEYGAYELRVTYPERVKKSLLFVFALAVVVFTSAALADSFKPDDGTRLTIRELTLEDIKQDEKKLEPIPEIKKPEPPPQVQTEKLTVFHVVPDEKADDPPPTTDDLGNAKIDLVKKDGLIDDGLVDTKELDGDRGIIEVKKDEPEVTFRKVEIEAKFIGNWEKFLTRNLNPNVSVDNGTPAGQYKVVIEFVVDKEGNVSDIKPLTNHGYGLEQEAIRVLKKASKWEPAIQNGFPVKAYRTQPITFVVEE